MGGDIQYYISARKTILKILGQTSYLCTYLARYLHADLTAIAVCHRKKTSSLIWAIANYKGQFSKINLANYVKQWFSQVLFWIQSISHGGKVWDHQLLINNSEKSFNTWQTGRDRLVKLKLVKGS